jgi:hypothetical protein
LALGTGVLNGATSAEAIAAGGVVTVSAESGASTVVTFTNGVHSVSKTVTGTGSAQAVTLLSGDLLTLTDGTISVSAVATDAAGNASSAGTSSFTLDTVAPTLSSGTAPSTSLSTVAGTAGNSAGETITLTVTFDGNVTGLTSGSDSTVLKVAGTGVSATWGGTTGTSTRTLTYTIASGQNGQATIDETALKAALIAGISDAAGNAFSYTANSGVIANIDSTALPVIDTTAPTAAAVTHYSGNNNSTVNAAEATAGFTISGTNELGATLTLTGQTVLVDSSTTWHTTLNNSTITGFGQGPESLTVVSTDAAGNTTNTPISLTVDTQAPSAPVISNVAGDDSISNAEATAGFNITGTGEIGATVTLSFDSGHTLASGNTTVVGVDGSWSKAVTSADVTAFGVGSEIISASQTDVAGNTSAVSTHTVTVASSVTPGQSTIDLGSGNGKLINGVQMGGAWYYYWDVNGDGVSNNHLTPNGQDRVSHNLLDTMFNGGADTTDAARSATINGVRLELPTAGEAMLACKTSGFGRHLSRRGTQHLLDRILTF